MRNLFSKQQLLFVLIFVVLGWLALQVPFTQLVGSKVKFTVFDFMGPIASGFIGTIPGVIAVLLMQVFNWLIHGAQVLDAGNIIRFFPMLAAVWYFGSKNKWSLLIPIAAIVAWNLHAIGQTVWYYSMFWLIPLVCYLAREKFLLARSLGATFTAHAVGGALWLYVFNLPAGVWQALIPIVAAERLLMAIGIAVSYVLLTNVVAWLVARKILPAPLLLDSKFVWMKKISF